jgi:hypothetical protein
MARKRPPELFSDEQELVKAFRLNYEPDKTGVTTIHSQQLLHQYAKGTTSWNEFLAKVREAKVGQSDQIALSSLHYLEVMAEILEEEEKHE